MLKEHVLALRCCGHLLSVHRAPGPEGLQRGAAEGTEQVSRVAIQLAVSNITNAIQQFLHWACTSERTQRRKLPLMHVAQVVSDLLVKIKLKG